MFGLAPALPPYGVVMCSPRIECIISLRLHFWFTSNLQPLCILDRGRQVHLEKIQRDAESEGMILVFFCPF